MYIKTQMKPVDFYIDDIKLAPFVRDRSWVPDANLRIEDIRKRDLMIDISEREDVDKVMIKMTKSEFYWGATMDSFLMGKLKVAVKSVILLVS